MSNQSNGARRIAKSARKFRTDDGLRVRRGKSQPRRTATRQAYVAAAVRGEV